MMVNCRPLERGRKQNGVKVEYVEILPTRTNFMWGLSQSENISTPYKLFKQAASGRTGPVNSFQVYFKILGVVPAGPNLLLKMVTSATGAVEHSIITNLPIGSASSKVICRFVTATSLITCENIGGLLDPSIEYFIAAKVYYASSATNPTNFGGLSITV